MKPHVQEDLGADHGFQKCVCVGGGGGVSN